MSLVYTQRSLVGDESFRFHFNAENMYTEESNNQDFKQSSEQ